MILVFNQCHKQLLAHHLRFFQFVLLKFYRENNENKQKEAGIEPFFQKN